MEVSIHYYSENFTRQQKMGWFWQNFFIAKEHYQGRTETFFCVFQCSNASRYITNSQTTQLSLRGKKGKLLNVKIPNELHSDIPPPLIDEPVKKISDKNGTEHQLKNNHEFIFSCVFQMSIQLMWLLFPEMALGERSRERRKKRKGGKKLVLELTLGTNAMSAGRKRNLSWNSTLLYSTPQIFLTGDGSTQGHCHNNWEHADICIRGSV